MEAKKNEKYDLERRRPLFFGIGMTITLSLTILAFEWKSPIDPIDMFGNPELDFEPELIIPPISIDLPPPPPPKAIEVIETTQEEEVTEDLPEIDVDSREEEIVEVIIPDEIPEEPVEEILRSWAEVMPSYKGGLQNFYQFIADNIKYPAQAKRLGVEGRVFVQFVVEKDGSLSNIQAVRGIGAGCDEEAVRVMELVRGFSPAKQGDIRVRVQMVVPISFKLK